MCQSNADIVNIARFIECLIQFFPHLQHNIVSVLSDCATTLILFTAMWETPYSNSIEKMSRAMSLKRNQQSISFGKANYIQDTIMFSAVLFAQINYFFPKQRKDSKRCEYITLAFNGWQESTGITTYKWLHIKELIPKYTNFFIYIGVHTEHMGYIVNVKTDRNNHCRRHYQGVMLKQATA